ncbi:MAG: hypothetical protein ACN6I5_01435 [Hyphomicrobiales bacterium]
MRDLVVRRDAERERARQQRDLAQQEQYGDQGASSTGQLLSGVAGCGSRCERALENARAAEAAAEELSVEISQLETSRDDDLRAIELAQANAIAQRAEQIAIGDAALIQAIADRDAEEERLAGLL